MTESEAIERLNRKAYRTTCYGNRVVEHEENLIAIKALEKQIPKKVIHIHSDTFDECLCCPNCYVIKGYFDAYCPACGQAIDWSDENEARTL